MAHLSEDKGLLKAFKDKKSKINFNLMAAQLNLLFVMIVVVIMAELLKCHR